ncbi:MAG: LURP-one-related family protein [Candidatus Bathyarchaeota archaeon]|jgi:uncharacterized protein YxjI
MAEASTMKIEPDEYIETGLLSSRVNYYVLKEKWWDWGSGDIYNEKGKSIGKMHRKVISLRALTEVTETNGTLVFSINKKVVSVRASYMIKDAQGNMLGRTNKKILTFFRPKLWLEDEDGKKLLEAQGNFLGRDFKIKDSKGNLKARIGKSDFFKDFLFGGVFDFSDTYAVKILDPEFDKQLLLGFVIAIDNSVHDKK